MRDSASFWRSLALCYLSDNEFLSWNLTEFYRSCDLGEGPSRGFAGDLGDRGDLGLLPNSPFLGKLNDTPPLPYLLF